MKVFQVYMDNGPEVEKKLMLAAHRRALMEAKPSDENYIKVVDVTDQRRIDAELLNSNLIACGYDDIDRAIILDRLSGYEGASNFVYVPPVKRTRKPKVQGEAN